MNCSPAISLQLDLLLPLPSLPPLINPPCCALLSCCLPSPWLLLLLLQSLMMTRWRGHVAMQSLRWCSCSCPIQVPIFFGGGGMASEGDWGRGGSGVCVFSGLCHPSLGMLPCWHACPEGTAIGRFQGGAPGHSSFTLKP